jgi:hypothetical protein
VSEVISLVLGVVLGVVAAALFEEDLRQMFANARTRRRRRRDRSTPVEFAEDFRLGPISTGFQVVEGDGTRAIFEHNVHIQVDARDVELPAELAPWRAEKAAEMAERAGAGPLWNGLRYAVSKVAVSRAGPREEPEIWMTLKHSNYLNFLTTQQLDRALPDGSTPRSRYLDGRSISELPDFMANSLGAHVALITADDFLVFSRRGPDVAVQPSMWSSSMGEGLDRNLDSEGTGPPSLYSVAHRGLREELGVERGQYKLELLAVGLARPVHQWVGLFTAQLTDLSWADLAEGRARGVQDPWEHGHHEAVRFYPDRVLEFILDERRRDKWTPMSPPLYYYALVKDFGRLRVERELRRLTRQ